MPQEAQPISEAVVAHVRPTRFRPGEEMKRGVKQCTGRVTRSSGFTERIK
jgi:hypothetical protein